MVSTSIENSRVSPETTKEFHTCIVAYPDVKTVLEVCKPQFGILLQLILICVNLNKRKLM